MPLWIRCLILFLSLTVLLIVTVLLIFTCYIHLYVCVCHTELKIFVFVFVFVFGILYMLLLYRVPWSYQTSPPTCCCCWSSSPLPVPPHPLRPAGIRASATVSSWQALQHSMALVVGLVCKAADRSGGVMWSRSFMFLMARDRPPRVLPAIWSRSNVDRGKPYF